MSTVPLQSYNSITGYHETVRLLRTFFLSKKFIEVDTQSRLSILAACEDPTTIATYIFDGVKWPLPQTGQMWLEYDLLRNPQVPGLFCITTSYRNERNPISTRHLKIFPMFEFEMPGTQDDLQMLLEELFEFLGFGSRNTYHAKDYETIAAQYGVSIVSSAEEARLAQDYGPVFLLKNFPIRTSPFWNMKKNGNSLTKQRSSEDHGDRAKKIDSILYGIETVGSAERSCNPQEMREWFYIISGGVYAQLLFDEFGRERVEQELEDYLSLNFFPRCGAGIGVTRLIRARELAKQQQTFIGAQRSASSQSYV